jgi:hypothetical protein
MNTWFERLKSEMDEAIGGMNNQQLEYAPAEKWNSANILEHLALAFGNTAKVFDKQLASDAKPTPRAPTLYERVGTIVVTRLGYFPGGRKAPAGVVPEGTDAETSVRSFHENLERMDRSIAAAEERWGNADKVAVHPVLGPLTVPEWRKFHYMHTHHHAKQVKALKVAQVIIAKIAAKA